MSSSTPSFPSFRVPKISFSFNLQYYLSYIKTSVPKSTLILAGVSSTLILLQLHSLLNRPYRNRWIRSSPSQRRKLSRHQQHHERDSSSSLDAAVELAVGLAAEEVEQVGVSRSSNIIDSENHHYHFDQNLEDTEENDEENDNQGEEEQESDGEEFADESKNLLTLLYSIAEDQARKGKYH